MQRNGRLIALDQPQCSETDGQGDGSREPRPNRARARTAPEAPEVLKPRSPEHIFIYVYIYKYVRDHSTQIKNATQFATPLNCLARSKFEAVEHGFRIELMRRLTARGASLESRDDTGVIIFWRRCCRRRGCCCG